MLFDTYRKLNLKNKIIAASGGFVLIIFGLVFFIVVPTIKDIRAMGQAIENQKIDLQEKYIKGFSSRQLTENLKKIEPKLNLLDQIFINKNRELEFITTLENEAGKSQVSQKINLASPKPTENQEFQENNLELTASGGFNRLLRYLTDLETLNYYINIKTLDISSAPGIGRTVPVIKNPEDSALTETDTNNLNMLISAVTYWK